MNTEPDNNGKTDVDGNTAEDLMNQFRLKFLSGPDKSTETKEPKDISEIAIDLYNQPEVTDELQKKIDRLQKITTSIEKNLIKTVEKDTAGREFKIDYRHHLNDIQHLVATTINGPLLVIAGAGSGKTRTIVYRVAYLLENGIPPEKILLLTFTRKASNEMLSRTSALLNDMRGQKVMGGTFHSFANHLLRKYANLLRLPPNFTIIDAVDSADVIDFIRREMNFSKKSRAFPKKGRVQSIISKARNCNISIEKVIEREFTGLEEFVDDIKVIAKMYGEYKKGNALFDYDDLLEVLRDSLKNNPRFCKRVQENFHYIMVDEFQDTNVVQKEIVDLIARKHRNIMVVGDDSQSIYAFRGANFENILRFPETYPDCKYARIEQNYRSTQQILDFTNSVIENAKIGYKKRLFTLREAPVKPVVQRFFSQEDEAESIVSRILELRENDLPLNEIAVLYRATYQGNYVQTELLKRNIPYVVYGGIKFVERRHVKDIIAYLRIILNPLDPVSWNRILKLIPGIGDVTASRIVGHIHESAGIIDFSGFTGFKYGSDIQELQDVLMRVSRIDMKLQNKIEVLKDYYKPILKSLESDYKNRLLDIDVLYSLAAKYDVLEKFLTDFALDPPSNQFQNQVTPLVDETEDKPMVLSTVHSAKGLEWNTVFVIHLLDGLFPSEKSIGSIEELEEERRLFYVATTRAKDRLFLTMPSNIFSYGGIFTLPSRFLAEMDEGKYELAE